MTLEINGDSQQFDKEMSVAELVELLAMKPDRIAVEVNRAIVPRNRWTETRLHEGDRLEIVHFVGGGYDRAE